jgi:hypothetical protein
MVVFCKQIGKNRFLLYIVLLFIRFANLEGFLYTVVLLVLFIWKSFCNSVTQLQYLSHYQYGTHYVLNWPRISGIMLLVALVLSFKCVIAPVFSI